MSEYRRQVTRREHLAWLAWLEMQWDRPSRSDYYAMQIAAEVRRSKGVAVSINDLRLPFGTRADEAEEEDDLTLEEATTMSKARWGSILKGVPRVS